MSKHLLTWIDEYDRNRQKLVTDEEFETIMDETDFPMFSDNVRLDGQLVR